MSGHDLDADLTTLLCPLPCVGDVGAESPYHRPYAMSGQGCRLMQRLGSEANPKHRIGSHLCTKVAPETVTL